MENCFQYKSSIESVFTSTGLGLRGVTQSQLSWIISVCLFQNTLPNPNPVDIKILSILLTNVHTLTLRNNDYHQMAPELDAHMSHKIDVSSEVCRFLFARSFTFSAKLKGLLLPFRKNLLVVWWRVPSISQLKKKKHAYN